MRERRSSLCLVLAGVVALAAVWLAAVPQGATAAKVELKLGHVGTVEISYHLGAERFAQLVAQGSGGTVTVKIFPNAQLGNERDLVEGLQLGTIQMAVSANAPLSRFTPRVLLFDLPFLFRDDGHWEKVVDGSLGQEIASQFSQFGFRSLGYFDGGWRSPYNSKRPIQKLDDVSGMKFRTMESPMHISIYQALGAKGVPMASSEQYTALQQGVVDGSDAPITWYRQLKHYEIAKHMSTLPLFKLTVHLLISEKAFKALAPDVQKVVADAGQKAANHQRERERQITATLLEELKGSGVKVSQLNPGELEKFVSAMQKSVWKEYEDKIGKERIAAAVNTR